MTADVTLQLERRLQDTSLGIRYVIENGTDDTLGLFNVVTTVGESGEMIFDTAFAYIKVEDRTLLVRKIVLPTPGRVAMRVVPAISRLGPRQRFVEEISLVQPVRVHDPYADPGRTPGVERVVDALCLQVGFFVVKPEVQLLPLSPAHPDVWRAFPARQAIEAQRILSAVMPLAPPAVALDHAPAR